MGFKNELITMMSLKCDILQHDDSSEDETDYKVSDDVISDTDGSVSDDADWCVETDSSMEMVVSINFNIQFFKLVKFRNRMF